MIIGIGTDIVKIGRIRSAHERLGDAFLMRVFTKGELRYCMARANPYPSLAARFAAKEALIKALPQSGGLFVSDIGVEADAGGAPRFERTPKVMSAFESSGVHRAHLSLTHEKEYAAAFVVIEGEGPAGE